MDRSFSLKGVEGLSGFLGPSVFAAGTVTLRELLLHLRSTYCGPVGWEYMHLASRDKRNWIRDRIEHTKAPVPPKEKRLAVYQTLAVADMVRWCAHRYVLRLVGLAAHHLLAPLSSSATWLRSSTQRNGLGWRAARL